MGCWNSTCSVTSLPILDGDETVLFFLKPSRNDLGGTLHYSSDIYVPFGLPIHGIYNDYGKIDNIEDHTDPKNIEFMTEYLKEHLIEMEFGENEYHDISVKREGFDLYIAQESVHESRLMVKDRHFVTDDSPMGFSYVPYDAVIRPMMVHKFAYDALMEETFDNWGDESFEEFVKSSDERYDDLFGGNLVEFIGDRSNEARLSLAEMRVESLYLQEVSRNDTLFKTLAVDITMPMLNTDKEFDRDLYLELLRVLWFDLCIGQMRKLWMPVTSLGSQSQSFDYYKTIAEKTIDYIEDVKKRYED